MEKNQKNQTQDLLERAVTLAELAGKCHRLGLIRDFAVVIKINNVDDYEVKVAVDEYYDTERIWYDSTRGYDARAKERTTDFETMAGHLQGLIDERKAQLLAELEIVEG